MSSGWSSRWWWKGMGSPMISQYGKFKFASGYRIPPKFYCHSPLSRNVMVSINEDSWHWTGEVTAGRVKGRTIKWGRDQLSIQWELGIRDDGYVPGQVTYDAPEISDLCKALLWRASSWVTPSSLWRWRHTKMTHQLLIFSQRNRIAFCSQQ